MVDGQSLCELGTTTLLSPTEVPIVEAKSSSDVRTKAAPDSLGIPVVLELTPRPKVIVSKLIALDPGVSVKEKNLPAVTAAASLEEMASVRQ